jgi:protein-S-isoprenylcysteine O-methyltransferase Ste14
MTLNRVVVILTVLAGIGGAIVPVAANMDWTSTAGVMAGLTAIVVAAVTWLIGWQKAEARENLGTSTVPVSVPAQIYPQETP